MRQNMPPVCLGFAQQNSSKEREVALPDLRSHAAEFSVVVHSHLRWSFVWQRPQHIHSRLSHRHPILFVEEPILESTSKKDRLEIASPMPNLWIVQPHLAPGVDPERRAVELLQTGARSGPLRSRFSRAVHWLYTPLMEPQIDAFGAPGAIVYDCMDELSKFAEAPPRLIEMERQLLKRADVVFAGGFELGAAKRRLHPNVHVFGCGVEFDHFHSAMNAPQADDLAMIPRPRLGYIGVIDERLDYGLLRSLARKNPSATIVMIGPVVKVNPNVLPRERNIVYLGPRDYAELPRYAAGFDVCLMPFAMNEASYYINPTKTLEYLATGRPVVATPVRDVVRQFPEVLTIADAGHFPDVVERVLAGERPDPERGIEVARHSSWDQVVRRMELYAALSAAARTTKASAETPSFEQAASA